MKNNIKWSFTQTPVSINVIRNVESKISVQFPIDYIECIKTNHGGHPDLEVFDFNGHKEAVFGYLLSFDNKESNFIVNTHNSLKNRMPERIIPFAEDPFGNQLCFDYRKGSDKSPHVVFWDHEEADKSPENAIHYVCDTFTDLLNKLYLPD